MEADPPSWVLGDFSLKYHKTEDGEEGAIVEHPGLKAEFVSIEDHGSLDALRQPEKRSADQVLYKEFYPNGTSDSCLLGSYVNEDTFKTKGVGKQSRAKWTARSNAPYYSEYYKRATLDKPIDGMHEAEFQHLKKKGMLVYGYDEDNKEFLGKAAATARKPWLSIPMKQVKKRIRRLAKLPPVEQKEALEEEELLSDTEIMMSEDEEDVEAELNHEAIVEKRPPPQPKKCVKFKESHQPAAVKLDPPRLSTTAAPLQEPPKQQQEPPKQKRNNYRGMYMAQLNNPTDEEVPVARYVQMLGELNYPVLTAGKFMKGMAKRLSSTADNRAAYKTELYSLMSHLHAKQPKLFKEKETMDKQYFN